TVASLVLANRKHVPVRVLKPGYFVPIRRRPDSKFGILNEGVLFEYHALLCEPTDDSLDIAQLPAHDGVWGWSEILHLCDSDHGFTGSHPEGELVVADELEPQLALVKAPSCLRILSRNK